MRQSTSPPRDNLVVRSLKRAVLGILLFGCVGTLIELLLIGHTDDAWQIVPLVLLVTAIFAIGAQLLSPGPQRERLLVLVMWACVLGGLAGQWLHYRGNTEFEREMYPDRSGLELFRESMSGATPVLAAGTMTMIGLFGLAAAWTPRDRR